jgi:hypothetical protein
MNPAVSITLLSIGGIGAVAATLFLVYQIVQRTPAYPQALHHQPSHRQNVDHLWKLYNTKTEIERPEGTLSITPGFPTGYMTCPTPTTEQTAYTFWDMVATINTVIIDLTCPDELSSPAYPPNIGTRQNFVVDRRPPLGVTYTAGRGLGSHLLYNKNLSISEHLYTINGLASMRKRFHYPWPIGGAPTLDNLCAFVALIFDKSLPLNFLVHSRNIDQRSTCVLAFLLTEQATSQERPDEQWSTTFYNLLKERRKNHGLRVNRQQFELLYDYAHLLLYQDKDKPTSSTAKLSSIAKTRRDLLLQL